MLFDSVWTESRASRSMCDFRPADVAPLVVLLLLTACGDDSANTTDDDVDADTSEDQTA